MNSGRNIYYYINNNIKNRFNKIENNIFQNQFIENEIINKRFFKEDINLNLIENSLKNLNLDLIDNKKVYKDAEIESLKLDKIKTKLEIRKAKLHSYLYKKFINSNENY